MLQEAITLKRVFVNGNILSILFPLVLYVKFMIALFISLPLIKMIFIVIFIIFWEV